MAFYRCSEYDLGVKRVLHWLRYKLTPPGNRGSLDTEYRQASDGPNMTNVNSPVGGHDVMRTH